MKNYWLDKKKACNKKWKRMEFHSTSGHTFVLEDAEWDCEKNNDKLEKWEATWTFTTDLSWLNQCKSNT